MRWVRPLAVVAGLGVTAALVWEIGPAALIAELRQLSWRLPLLLLPQTLVTVLDAAGWRCAFPGRRPGLLPLIGARLAGEAINDTTPTGTVGGEPVKAWLLTHAQIPFEESLASVVIAKTAFVASQVAFLGLGLALAAWRLGPEPALMGFMALLTVVALVAVGGFIWAQQRGLFATSSRALCRLGIAGAVQLRELDARLRDFYRTRRARFALALIFHFLGWTAGCVEVWLALRFLGKPVDLITALVIEAFATGIRSASFLVPASVGVQEGGLVAIFVGSGLSASAGLAVGVVRRLREAVWGALGYAVLAAWRGAHKPGAGPGA